MQYSKGRRQKLTRFWADSGVTALICKPTFTNLGIKPDLLNYDSYNIQSSISTIENAVLGKMYLNVFLLSKENSFGVLKRIPFLVCGNYIVLEFLILGANFMKATATMM